MSKRRKEKKDKPENQLDESTWHSTSPAPTSSQASKLETKSKGSSKPSWLAKQKKKVVQPPLSHHLKRGSEQEPIESMPQLDGFPAESELTYSECDQLVQIVLSAGQYTKNLLDKEMKKILRSRLLTVRTFFPVMQEEEYFTEFRSSPYLAAAQSGNVIALDYFLTRFGDIVGVNYSGTCKISHVEGQEVEDIRHGCTALVAACQSKDSTNIMRTVQLLVSQGASVNMFNCRKTTPLMAAAFQSDRLEIVKYLVEHGADVNALGIYGSSVLTVAARKGNCKTMQYLIKNGAIVHHRSVTGKTPLQIAAVECQLEAVRVLLGAGASPEFHPVDFEKAGYIPPPILLAASEGADELVAEFLKLPSCPPELKVDALLLLGAMYFEERKLGRIGYLERVWREAMEIREQLPPSKYLPPIEAYGNREEIRTVRDWEQLRESPLSEIYFQALIIRERCLGYGSLGMIDRLSESWAELMLLGRSRKAEKQWIRMMEMHVFFVASRPREYMAYSFHHVFYFSWLDHLEYFLRVVAVPEISSQMHVVEYKPFVEFIMKGIEFWEMPSNPGCTKPSLSKLIVHALRIFCLWLVQLESTDQCSNGKLNADCESLGWQFVSKCHHLLKKSTLLHLSLDSDLYENPMSGPDSTTLLTALLRWGADEAIDALDSKGERPLHLAITNPDAVVCLLESGAHVDAVNKAGTSAVGLYKARLGILKTPRLHVLFCSSPLPLFCQASHRIVKESLPYEQMDLPQHIKDFVGLHDKNVIK